MPWGEPGASGLLRVAHMGFNSCVGLEPVFLKYVLGQSKSQSPLLDSLMPWFSCSHQA